METIPFLDEYFRATKDGGGGGDGGGGVGVDEEQKNDKKEIETFAIKLARARLDCSARNAEANGKKDRYQIYRMRCFTIYPVF